MSSTQFEQVKQQLQQFDSADPSYATQFVESLLSGAQSSRASDVHLTPNGRELEVCWRLDGVLQSVGQFPSGSAADIVSRLKVLAELLTYKTDVPQEGRIRESSGGIEMRVSTFPTMHGERAVVRLFAAQGGYRYLDDLGFPAEVTERLQQVLIETSGAVIISGPAGSGKTTTAYACVRELARAARGGRSVVSLEDPIEVAVEGVAQSQVNAAAGFDLTTGLRSIMRQDPEVILLGEIRDREAAETAFQASLTGHLVITTFHTGSAAEAINRLSDMGIEPYLLRSGILAILSQRLLRRLCKCAVESDESDARLGLLVSSAKEPVGCADCLNLGYQGRAAVVEMLIPQANELGRAILSRADAAQLEQHAIESGMKTRWQHACELVETGVTSAAEVRRILGFSDLTRQ